MAITYAEIYSELNAAGSSPNGSCSAQLLRDSTGRVFSEYLLSGQDAERPADGNGSMSFDDNSRRVGIVNCVCEGKYDSAIFSLSVWLQDRISSGAETLTYDEAQFLAFLHIILKNYIDPGSEQVRSDPAGIDSGSAHIDILRSTKHSPMSFSSRTTRVLKRMGISTYDEIDSLGKRGLCKMRGCGEKTLNEISSKMREMGYNW